DRPEPEHHDRVAQQPVAELAVPWKRLVLGDRERRDVPDAAPLEVPGGSVVDGVLVTPALKGCKHEQHAGRTEPVVHLASRQAAAVRAIVEDDVGAYKEA